MSDNNRSRPVFLKATNVTGLTMTGNTVKGDADFAELENVTGLVAHGNKHITPNLITSLSNKKWFEKPLGIVLLAVVGAVLSGGLIYYFGWN